MELKHIDVNIDVFRVYTAILSTPWRNKSEWNKYLVLPLENFNQTDSELHYVEVLQISTKMDASLVPVRFLHFKFCITSPYIF